MTENNSTASAEFAQKPPEKLPGEKKFFFINRRILIVAVFLLVLLFFVFLFVSSQSNKVLRIIGGEEIRQSDVSQLKNERFSSGKGIENEEKVEEVLLEDLVIEKIVQNEATRRGIAVSDAEIEEAIVSYEVKSDALRRLTYNTLLFEKVKNAVVTWRVADYLFVYKEPILENYEELEDTVLESMENVKISFSKTGSLKSALEEASASPNFDPYITLTEGRKVYYENFDKSIATQLFQHKKGELTGVINSGAGTFILAQIMDSNDTSYKTMNEWLLSMKDAVQ